jgi:hypothetical protein
MSEPRHPGKRKVSKITIPDRCHPAVKVVFAEMKRQGVTYDELEYRAGVLKTTFKAWRTHNKPGLEAMEAALGSLGWSYLPVPSIDHLPASIRGGLQALAAEWGEINPLLCQLLAEVARNAEEARANAVGSKSSPICSSRRRAAA